MRLLKIINPLQVELKNAPFGCSLQATTHVTGT